MKRVVTMAVAVAVSTPAIAGSYRVVLAPVAGQKLVGHAGVEAVDETTAAAHVRLISPGNEVTQRGTVRVLVRNLGSTPFEFGPNDVTLRLGDGTELKPTPLDAFEKGAALAQRETRRAAAVDMAVRNSLSTLIAQSGDGSIESRPSGATLSSAPAVSTTEHNRPTEELLLPGGKTQDALYQLLLPETVAPKEAWGGYYVFDVPKSVLKRRADQPLTVIVRTRGEEHRFAATLRWK